jgi:hypothetical protein
VVVRDGRAITAGLPDYRQLDFAPLPRAVAGLVPNGVVAPRAVDRLLEGEDAAAQAALAVQVRSGMRLTGGPPQQCAAAATLVQGSLTMAAGLQGPA